MCYIFALIVKQFENNQVGVGNFLSLPFYQSIQLVACVLWCLHNAVDVLWCHLMCMPLTPEWFELEHTAWWWCTQHLSACLDIASEVLLCGSVALEICCIASFAPRIYFYPPRPSPSPPPRVPWCMPPPPPPPPPSPPPPTPFSRLPTSRCCSRRVPWCVSSPLLYPILSIPPTTPLPFSHLPLPSPSI